MCIIIAKRKNGRIPTESELHYAFNYNNDGAGFMYVDNNKVIIDKGYMKYKDFIARYNQLLEKYNNFTNKSLVIHCRIGTSGTNSKGNTHPYPITSNSKELKKTHFKSDIGIAHNGIIRDYELTGNFNDTQAFIIKYLYPIYSHYKDFYKNKYITSGIADITNSKFVILDTKDNIYKIGNFIEDKGLYFSNDSYLPPRYNYNYNYSYNGMFSGNYDYLDNEDTSIKEYNESYNFYEDDELFPLDENWYIDLYGNGNIIKVENKEYYINLDTLDLLEYINGDFEIIAKNPVVFDEKYQEIF